MSSQLRFLDMALFQPGLQRTRIVAPAGPATTMAGAASKFVHLGSKLARTEASVAAFLVGFAVVSRRRRTCLAAMPDEREPVEEASDPQGPSDLSISRLLSWTRKEDGFIVSPGVHGRDGSLAVSLPLSKGDPIIGVMWTELLFAGESADVSDRELAALQLGYRLLKEIMGIESNRPWPSAYAASLPKKPALPLLWNSKQQFELHEALVIQRVQEQVARARSWLKTQTVNDDDLWPSFAPKFASALSRAIEVEPGMWAMVPLLDLVGPGGPANCRLEVEDLGSKGKALILYTLRDIQPGEALFRDVNVDSSDNLMLQYGVPSSALFGSTELSASAYLAENFAEPWQLHAILRRVPGAVPGRLQGDVKISGKLQTSASSVSATVGEQFVTAALILSVAAENDLPDASTLQTEVSAGLEALPTARRIACFDALLQLLRSCKAELASSAEDDAKLLAESKGCMALAVAFRLPRKQIIDTVMQQVEKELDLAMTKLTSNTKSGGSLPFAVIGK
eukprot:TRINITY_DN109092_c0_g1_i1.p1 TRINITY_DN109092_c0_g1~~TRINITY_DN109092_c0_g1_i1.p1  ORF type:complete len:509 (+),score=87.57 TRINITY_DN109092_c0_g1_i1:27-1553(+)